MQEPAGRRSWRWASGVSFESPASRRLLGGGERGGMLEDCERFGQMPRSLLRGSLLFQERPELNARSAFITLRMIGKILNGSELHDCL